jgi:signal transduction histidine kinase
MNDFMENAIIEPFLQFAEQNVLSLFYITAISSLFFAWILYNSANAEIGRWIRLLGWFFFTFFVMYGLRIMRITADFSNESYILIFIGITNQILSIINSFLMLIAAKELLSENIKTEIEKKEFFLTSFVNQIKAFAPNSIKLLALSAFILPFLQPILNWLTQNSFIRIIEYCVRLPDTIFSAYCFVYLGYALWMNITFLHRKWVAIAGLLPTLHYALTQILYLVNPIAIPSHELYRWDIAIFVISLPLKIAIFLTAYYLSFKILQVFTKIRHTIDLVTNTRKNFLSSTGIIEAVGKSLNAESVTLFIRTPSKSDKRVVLIKWLKEWNFKDKTNNKTVSIEDHPELKKIFNEGKSSHPKMTSKSAFKFLRGGKAEIVAIRYPLLFNGAVIGCLEVELNEFAAYTNVINQQIELFVNRLSIEVQSYRESLSLRHATYRCASYQFDDLENGSQAIVKITETIDDILSPVGIRILANVGFKQQNHIIADDENTEFLKRLTNNFRDDSNEDFNRSISREKESTLQRRNLLLRDSLMELAFEGSRPFGKVFLLIKGDKDDIGSPTLGVYSMQRSAMATVISNALVDLAHNYLSNNLKNLDIELSQEPISISQWFQLVSEAARKAEILWTVSTNPHSDDNFLGEENYIEMVKEFWEIVAEDNQKPLFANVIGKGNTCHIVTLRLENTKQIFWFGVENPNFSFELEFNSPWRSFLEHLAEIADAVLFKIHARQNQVENTSYHALATMATTTGTIVHQLVNMTRNNEVGFSAIYEGIINETLIVKDNDTEEIKRKGDLYKDLVSGLKDSGEQMLELTQAFREITKFSEERPCNLRNASERAEKLFHSALTQNSISIDTEINMDILIDIPFHIAALTLANLFSNAKDALKSYPISDRKIRIRSREEKNFIVCSFADNGPGIPEKLQPEMFKLGKTTKHGGGGWGLYLVKRALRENGSQIELKSSKPGHTEFKITFPKAYKLIK